MKLIKLNILLLMGLSLVTFNSVAQDYGDFEMKINNYVVKTYSQSSELSNTVTPYETALEVSGLTFKQIPPYDPQTDQAENKVKIGDRSSKNQFIMFIRPGEWVSGFVSYNNSFQISIGSRVFSIGDSRSQTLSKLDLGYEFWNDNQDVVKISYNEAIFLFFFKNGDLSGFDLDNELY